MKTFNESMKAKQPEVAKNKDNSVVKSVSEVVACVVDYGTFICLADKLGETFKKVYYYTPTSQEFYSIDDLVKGTGLDNVERVEDIFSPDFLDKIDLFIFPDIGYEGLQKHLRSLGKAVWGSMGADELELFRTTFLETMKKLKLPVIHTETVVGLTNLREHLSKVKNKFIKVNKYRGNMETWHHIDMEHSEEELNRLAVQFGGMKDTITFVVQDYIKTDVEIGYDGWCVDGEFPSQCYQGYEKKNELYLGSLRSDEDMPEPVKLINDALAPMLKKMKYRNFIATEIRIKDDIPYFIDPTMRMPGQTGEQLLETCLNLAEVVWYGANGELIDPVFDYDFSAAATMHYTAGGEWSILKVPEKIAQWVKLYHYCKHDDHYHFPPKGNNELGVVLGAGNTIEEAIGNLKKHLKDLKDEAIECKLAGFADLLEDIVEAKKFGIEFTHKKIPDPKDVL